MGCARPYVFILAMATLSLLGLGAIYGADVPMVLPLYGTNFLSTLGVLLVDASCIILALAWLRRHNTDIISCAIFLLWAVLSLHYMHISFNQAYTNDINGHFPKAYFIAHHWLEPYGYHGWEDHQPPLFYYFAGAAIRIGEVIRISPFLAVRFLAWIFFAIFSIYSLLALKRSGLTGWLYYVCALLLLCWPASIHAASKINSECMYYALYAAAFYYALGWYRQRRDSDLAKAICLGALSFAVRTNGIIIMMVIGALILAAWVRRWSPAGLVKQYGLLLCAVCAACVFLNIGNMFFTDYSLDYHLGSTYMENNIFPMSHYFVFHYDTLLNHPYNDDNGIRTQGFWDYFLQTAIYGEYLWHSPALATTLNFTLVVMVAYVLAAWLIARREEWRGMLPHLCNTLLPLALLIWFFERTKMYPTEDIRYIYPSVLSFVVFYGNACTIYQKRGALALSVLGPLLALIFTTLSIVHFWIDFR